jgi:tripartite-type tricarboxylate transporter receptor subunit TctC
VPVVADLAGNADDRALIELVLSGCALGRPLAVTPDTPPERVAALRAAFDATVKDPEFLAEAKTLNLDVDAVRGVDMQKTVAHILDTPQDVARRAKHLLE